MSELSSFSSSSMYHINNLLIICFITAIYLFYRMKKEKVIVDMSKKSLKLYYGKYSELVASYFFIYVGAVYLMAWISN